MDSEYLTKEQAMTLPVGAELKFGLSYYGYFVRFERITDSNDLKIWCRYHENLERFKFCKDKKENLALGYITLHYGFIKRMNLPKLTIKDLLKG